MCGIFGLVWREGSVAGGVEAIREAANLMRDSIDHRGPDGAGLIEGEGFLLGHLRLALIDPEGGRQPMTSPDGRVALSYNGECYNFPELMLDLSRRGWTFATRCDSETLLAGYCLHGENFDERLNGMYAYAIHDGREGRGAIQLSTDPIGIKPLFLCERDGLVLFASELRAIVVALQRLGRSADIDQRALAAYLRLGWIPAPLSLVSGARKLLPGERWRIDLASAAAQHRSTRGWPAEPARARDVAEFDEVFGDALAKAVNRQMISDVPVGFFLSGGIDSSLLLAVARQQGHDASSFTIRFTGGGHGVAAADEAEVASAVAKKLGSTFHCINVDGDTLHATLTETLSAMDQPLADPACLPLLLLSRFARDTVKVCLSGDGGDELFAGYPRHGLIDVRRRWHRAPRALRALTRQTARALPSAPGSGFRESLRKARVAHGLIDAAEYVSGPFAEQVEAERAIEPWNFDVPAESRAVMEADFHGQLAGQMLPKTDNMTMAASLECRVPLLDLELVGLAASAPFEWKRSSRSGKLPLRRQLARYLPPEITNRPKHGFRVPLTSWFRGSMADEVQDRLLARNGAVEDFLGRGTVRVLLEEHLSGRAEHSVRIWSLLALDNWLGRLGHG
jgi:asparagine synthase (glutamine-hydrolysing)